MNTTLSDSLSATAEAEAGFANFDLFTEELRQNRIKSTNALHDQSFNLYFSESQIAKLYFDDYDQAHWTDLPLSDHLAHLSKGMALADVAQIALNIYFISLALDVNEKKSISILLDTDNKNAILVLSELDISRKKSGAPSNFKQHFLRAHLTSPLDSTLIETTRDLLGMRYLSVYSKNLAVEHIYLNSDWYAYHIHGGVRHGECYCDEASFYKIRDGLYLLAFREVSVDVAIVLILDCQALQSTGIVVGEVEENQGWFTVHIGAKMSFLSKTDYPEGYVLR